MVDKELDRKALFTPFDLITWMVIIISVCISLLFPIQTIMAAKFRNNSASSILPPLL